MPLHRFITVLFSLVALMSPTPLKAQSQDPSAILEQSASALREIAGFSAQFKMYGDGGSMFADTLPSMNGRMMVGELDGFGKIIHIIGEARDQKNAKPMAVDIMLTKDKALWTNHTNRTINEASRKNNLRGAPSALGYIFLDSVILDDPYAQDTNGAQSITLGEQETIAGTPCDVITIKRSDPSTRPKNKSSNDSYTDVKWYIGTKDKLPRKVDRITDAGMIKLSLIFELGTIRLSPPPANQLDIARPEGYTFKSSIRKPRQKPDNAAPAQPPTTKTAPAPRIRMMPSYTFNTADGTAISNDSQTGRITVLYFWGSWCSPCKEASPLISEMAKEQSAKPVDIFGLAIREADTDQTRSDFNREKYNHQLVLDSQGLTSTLGVRVYPTIVVVNASGEIIFQESIRKQYDSAALVEQAKKAINKALASNAQNADE